MRSSPLLVLLLSAAAAAPALDLHVAPSGDDAHAGTAAAPLRTLAAARAAARRVAGRESVTVHVAEGVYYLPETLVFSAEDSGAPGKPVVYAAEHEGRAVISGGQRLALQWAAAGGGLFRAATPPGLAIDQLFVNGRRQRMARYPNYDPAKTTEAYQGWAADAFSKERAARWSDPAGGYIHAMHSALWGGYHYRITGKKADGTVAYEGGWQNNRQMGMHRQFRMVENIREELDAPGEWFHDAKAGVLYLLPEPGVDPAAAIVEGVRLRALVEFRGTPAAPVRHVALSGFVFRHAARTFMDTREPLLRSDWTIYRGGAVFFTGAEDCAVLDSEFDQLGGNAVFASGYNRRLRIAGCDLHDTGASAVAFVGEARAVRSPLFEYNEGRRYAEIDPAPGPKSDDYPADCVVEDCLIRHAGEVEKQATGVEISMAQGITVRHCSIYDMSRAGINIGDGTFGGHVIEYCDVFDTVNETGDHGSFNAWGRDRYWHLKDAPEAELPRLALLDAVKPTILRNSRWRCDHGWDVDLDDGSSNYEIYNNLFLHGGLKLREGFHRRVWNNIAVNNTLHPHVWYRNCGDIVTNNIWMAAYRPAVMHGGKWGAEIDRNLFTSDADRRKFEANGCDANSRAGDPQFVDAAAGDYRVKDGSPALALGFRNFPMDQFGVRKPALRAKARTPQLPSLEAAAAAPAKGAGEAALVWLGAALHTLQGEEFSAFGTARDAGGVQLVEVPAGSAAAAVGLQKDDLVLGLNGAAVRDAAALVAAWSAAGEAPLRVKLVRGQAERQVVIEGAPAVAIERSAGTFARLAPPTGPRASATAQPGTDNEPIAVLTDGALARNYGPVFHNGVRDGEYRIDLGKATALSAVTAWSWNQNGNRGRQFVTVCASATEAGPFVPLATIDTGAGAGDAFVAASLRASPGKTLGTWRRVSWRVHPVTPLQENTAYQEFAIEAAP